MRVCIVSTEYPPHSGGIGSYVYNLSKMLYEKDHTVTVITSGTSNSAIKQSLDEATVIRLPLLPVYPFHLWLYGSFVNKLLRSSAQNFDLVHLHSPASPPVKTSLPVVTTVHSTMKIDSRYYEVTSFRSLADKLQSALVYPFIEKEIFSYSNKICSVSKTVANELESYCLDSNSVEIVGNGVDEQLFTPLDGESFLEPYILYTGRLSARKGLFDLIDCAEQVLSKHSNLKFLIAGRGHLFGQLAERVRQLGLQKKIVFLGYVDKNQFVHLYQNALIHLVPSHYEGLPTVLLEAMSCGLPVVATNIGGSNEVITSGVNGFLVSPKSPEEMADKIELLLNDSALRKKIGSEARATIEKNYTWSKVCDRIVKCYEDVLY